MASAVPFNPDDFENNNPFAEPVNFASESIVGGNSLFNNEPEAPEADEEQEQQEENVTDDVETYTSHQDVTQRHENENINEIEPESGAISSQLDEKVLRKLIPERFTKKFLIKITLKSLESNKAGNPILNFDVTVTGLQRFRQTVYKEVRRTYNEVQKFNKYLMVSNLEVCVPVIPLAITSFPTGGTDEVKQLLYVWQEWFDRITSNPILILDEEFVFFIENDFGYSVINSNRKTAIASGLVRKTLKQLQVPYDPYEELAEFRPLIKSAYLTCQKLHKVLDKKSKTDKQLSIYISELAQKLNQLSEFEMIHPGMKNMWEKLAKITSIQSDLILIELVNEMGNLGDGIQAFIDDFYQIKEALTNRHLVMREYATAEKDTKAKHVQATKIKNKSSLDPLKVDEAIRSLEYATKTEESLNLQLKRISGEMLFEKKEIINHTEKKLCRMLQGFTLHKVDHHRKILKHLENIRLDIRIVDEKGGLSRLNRENLSNLKHNLTQSQAANGDSWSHRTFRSLNAKTNDPDHEEYEVENANPVDAKHAASLLGVATF